MLNLFLLLIYTGNFPKTAITIAAMIKKQIKKTMWLKMLKKKAFILDILLKN